MDLDCLIMVDFGRTWQSVKKVGQKIKNLHCFTTRYKQTDKYLTEKQLNLNADKTEMLFFTNHTNSEAEFTFTGEVTEPAHACRYLGVHIDWRLTFENHLNSVSSKMATSNHALYLVRNQIPLKFIIDVFKSFKLSHFSFSGVFFQTPTAKNIICTNSQTNRGIKICYFRQKLTIPLIFSIMILSCHTNCLSRKVA